VRRLIDKGRTADIYVERAAFADVKAEAPGRKGPSAATLKAFMQASGITDEADARERYARFTALRAASKKPQKAKRNR
jgi:hypothetical protein